MHFLAGGARLATLRRPCSLAMASAEVEAQMDALLAPLPEARSQPLLRRKQTRDSALTCAHAQQEQERAYFERLQAAGAAPGLCVQRCGDEGKGLFATRCGAAITAEQPPRSCQRFSSAPDARITPAATSRRARWFCVSSLWRPSRRALTQTPHMRTRSLACSLLTRRAAFAQQQEANKCDARACAHCFRYVGSVEEQIARRLLGQVAAAGETEGGGSASADGASSSSSAAPATPLSFDPVPLDLPALAEGRKRLPHSERFALPPAVACLGGCDHACFCSAACADAAWRRHHRLLCTGPRVRHTLRHTLCFSHSQIAI